MAEEETEVPEADHEISNEEDDSLIPGKYGMSAAAGKQRVLLCCQGI
jgi:hypothetical protein